MKELDQSMYLQELSDDDQEHIREVFYHEVVPKLIKLAARVGTLNCGFAGERYRHWSIQFRSMGSGFDIAAFEYDQDGEPMDLDL